MTLKESFEESKAKNRAVAILGRHQYAGFIKEVHEDYVVMENAWHIEIAGFEFSLWPRTASKFTTSIVIPFNSIDCIHEPNWLPNLMKHQEMLFPSCA